MKKYIFWRGLVLAVHFVFFSLSFKLFSFEEGKKVIYPKVESKKNSFFDFFLEVNKSQDFSKGKIKPLISIKNKLKKEIFSSRKGIYMTSWIAGTKRGLYLLEKIKEAGLDTIVIDMKDASGYVTYDSENDLVNEFGFKEVRISKKRLSYIIEFCKKNNIRTIARVVVSKDPLLSKVRDN